MRIRHFCAGLEKWNGMAVAARLIMREQDADFLSGRITDYDEIWVHGTWTVPVWWTCLKVILSKRRLVRMTHGNLDPVRLGYHGWKKWLAGPIERFFFRRATKVVATCEVEAEWIRAYEPRVDVEITDLKRFFKLEGFGDQTKAPLRGALHEYAVSPHSDFRSDRLRTGALHVLYLGRRHPLKGVGYLEQAVAELNQSFEHSEHSNIRTFDLRIVSNATGEELEKVWEWCDVLVLPTLSENFGLVVAEALERGKRVVTTDGAPVWEGQPGIVYLKGYREGTDEERVELLKKGLIGLMGVRGE